MKIPKITYLSFKSLLNKKNSEIRPLINFRGDSFVSSIENDFDKSVLVNQKIISKDKNLEEFFDEFSNKVFKDENAKTLSDYLKKGYVTFSTSIYRDIKSPFSAKGIVLNPLNSPVKNCAVLEDEIKHNRGVGVNFSEFDNPIEQIRKINSYFKYREASSQRPPAGIALLNINHPQILDFITLKDKEDFKDWCFDLSVVIPDDFLTKVNTNENITLSNGKTLRAKVIYNTLLNSMTKTGEPGVIFSNDKDYICDCCATASLKKDEALSLAHINLSKFYNNSKFDYDLMEKSADILSMAVKNIDSNGYIGILGYQTLLDKMNILYGSKEGNEILEKILKIIRAKALKNNIKTAISPTGSTARFLKVSPSIEPRDNSKISYFQEIDTLATAQKYLDGNISKTIILNPDANIDDVASILKYAKSLGVRGISVYKP